MTMKLQFPLMFWVIPWLFVVSSLKCPPRSPLTKELFLVTIEYLIVFRNGHEKWCYMPPLLIEKRRLSPVFR